MNPRSNAHLKWLAVVPALALILYFVFFLYQDPTESIEARPDATNLATDSPEFVIVDTDEQPALPAEPVVDDQLSRDREFISYAFPVLSSWNVEAVKPLLADATVAASTDEEMKEVMTILAGRLGELESFEMPQPAVELDAGDDSDELSHYRFNAQFEAGEAEVSLVLHRQMDQNSLYSFNIHVPN